MSASSSIGTFSINPQNGYDFPSQRTYPNLPNQEKFSTINYDQRQMERMRNMLKPQPYNRQRNPNDLRSLVFSNIILSADASQIRTVSEEEFKQMVVEQRKALEAKLIADAAAQSKQSAQTGADSNPGVDLKPSSATQLPPQGPEGSLMTIGDLTTEEDLMLTGAGRQALSSEGVLAPGQPVIHGINHSDLHAGKLKPKGKKEEHTEIDDAADLLEENTDPVFPHVEKEKTFDFVGKLATKLEQAGFKKSAEKFKMESDKLKQKLEQAGAKADQELNKAAAKLKAKAEKGAIRIEEKGQAMAQQGKVKTEAAYRMFKSSEKKLRKSQDIAQNITQAKQNGQSEVVVSKNGKNVSMSLEKAEKYANSLNQKAADLKADVKLHLKSGQNDVKVGKKIQTLGQTVNGATQSTSRIFSNSTQGMKKAAKESGLKCAGGNLGSSVAEVIINKDQYSSGWAMAADCIGKTISSTASEAATAAVDIITSEALTELFPKVAEKIPGLSTISTGYSLGKRVITAESADEAMEVTGKTAVATLIKMSCTTVGTLAPWPIVGTVGSAAAGTAICHYFGIN